MLCDDCIELTPNINNVFKELPQTEYYFNYYDTDDNRIDDNFTEVLDNLGIETVPTIIIYDYKSGIMHKIDDQKILGNYDLLLKEITSASKNEG